MLCYLDDPVNLGPKNPEGWYQLDYSSYIPNYANGVILHMDGADCNVGWNPDYEPVHYSSSTWVNDLGLINNNTEISALVKVDANLKSWVCFEGTSVNCRLVGYTAAPGVVFYDAPVLVPSTGSGYTTTDVSGIVPTGAKALILRGVGQSNTTSFYGTAYARPTGSTVAATFNFYYETVPMWLGATPIFALDGSYQIDIDNDSRGNVVAIGYIMEGTWYGALQSNSYTQGASWATHTVTQLSDQYQSPVFYTTTGRMRRVGSSTDYTCAPGAIGGIHGAKPDSSKQIQLYSTTAYLCGFLPGTPPAPTGFSVAPQASSDTGLTVSWDDPGSGHTVNVKYRTAGVGGYTTVSSLTGSSYNITSLTTNTEYDVKISFTNNYGEGTETSVETLYTAKLYSGTSTDESDVAAKRRLLAFRMAASGSWDDAVFLEAFESGVDGTWSKYWQVNGLKIRVVHVPDLPFSPDFEAGDMVQEA